MADRRVDEPTGVETVGHEWDGIEELNNPLPRWWLITLFLTVVFALGYVVVYPAIPLLRSGTAGMWGWTSRGQLADEMQAADAERAKHLVGLSVTPIEQLPQHPELMRAAIAGGRAAFRVNCVQCHGSNAKGGAGYPNLTDPDWLWGGNLKEIEATITNGVRQPGNDSTHASLMPSFGKDGILTAAQVSDVASYVRSLSNPALGGAAAARGAPVFAANCVACHGPQGKGLRQFGAPNLTDVVWLYGGSQDQVVASITQAHAGVMPAWGSKLSPDTIKMLATYVHSLGGGEDFTAGQTQAEVKPANAKP